MSFHLLPQRRLCSLFESVLQPTLVQPAQGSRGPRYYIASHLREASSQGTESGHQAISENQLSARACRGGSNSALSRAQQILPPREISRNTFMFQSKSENRYLNVDYLTISVCSYVCVSTSWLHEPSSFLKNRTILPVNAHATNPVAFDGLCRNLVCHNLLFMKVGKPFNRMCNHETQRKKNAQRIVYPKTSCLLKAGKMVKNIVRENENCFPIAESHTRSFCNQATFWTFRFKQGRLEKPICDIFSPMRNVNVILILFQVFKNIFKIKSSKNPIRLPRTAS